MKHDVRGDRPTETGWHRFTCYGAECQHATCLRQPYMGQLAWATAKADFLTTHETEEREVRGWPDGRDR